MTWWRSLPSVAILICVACGGGDDEHCGNLMTAFAVVTVKDAEGGARICSADVTFSVGGEDFVAEATDSPCEYTLWSGKLDRDMQLLVEADGFRSYLTSVRVPTGTCGPVTQSVSVTLNPS